MHSYILGNIWQPFGTMHYKKVHSTLQALLFGNLLQTVPSLVTPLKRCFLNLCTSLLEVSLLDRSDVASVFHKINKQTKYPGCGSSMQHWCMHVNMGGFHPGLKSYLHLNLNDFGYYLCSLALWEVLGETQPDIIWVVCVIKTYCHLSTREKLSVNWQFFGDLHAFSDWRMDVISKAWCFG